MATKDDKKQDTFEISPDSTIEAGADFTAPNPFLLNNASPDFRYFSAVESTDGNRPGSVPYCKMLGYEIDPDHKSDAPGHVWMRIPVDKFNRRQAYEQNQAKLNQESSMEDFKHNLDPANRYQSPQHGIKRN